MFHASLTNMATEATALSVRAVAFGHVPEIAQQVEKPLRTNSFRYLYHTGVLCNIKDGNKLQRVMQLLRRPPHSLDF